MTNADFVWNPDEALDRWEKIAAEESREKDIKKIAEEKETLPYSERLAQELCERVGSGELLTVICTTDAHMPTARNVTRWLKSHQDFAALYQMALQDRLTIFEDQIIEFADDKSKDVQRATASNSKEKIQFVDPVQRAKLQIEVRMRHLRAGRPAKWGDVSTLITKEADPYDCANLSADEIEAKSSKGRIRHWGCVARHRSGAMSDLDDKRKERAEEVAKRRWANADIARRYKEAQQNFAPDDPDNPFETQYGKTQRPTAPPAARVITPSDADIETVEKQRAKRVKTVAELRKVTKFLQDIIRSGRSTITVRGAELKGPRREATLAGYRASLEMRKRRLLLEKLRRLEANPG